MEKPSSPEVPQADVWQVVALGERLATISDEGAVAPIVVATLRAMLGARAAAWLTDRSEHVEGADWDETSRLVLRHAALAELAARPHPARGATLTSRELPPSLAEPLGSGVLQAAPLRAWREPVGVLCVVVDAESARSAAVLAMIAQTVSARLTGQRASEQLAGEVGEITRMLEARTRELRRAELQIVASDRLAMLGTLVAGIGHEITNPLATVMLNSGALVNRLARANLPAKVLTEAQRVIAENDEALERIRSLVGELRTFARKDDEGLLPLDLRPVVDGSLRLCRAHLRHVDLKVELGTVPAIRGSASRLGQVLLNLLVNAAQALHGRPDARIEVRVESTDHEVRVGVIDNGPGVPAEQRERIFEMFYTTKVAGEGTGLGLAIARDIAAKHGGRIELEDTPGGGASFWLVLPTAQALAHGEQVKVPRTPSSPAIKPARRKPSLPALEAQPAGPRPRVLVIDDEVMILRALERELENDFEVVVVADGAGALAALAGGRFDAVLCDVNLAGEMGPDVVARLEQQAPGLAARTIFMSGVPMVTPPGRPGRFVSKPFQMSTLQALLRQVASDGAPPEAPRVSSRTLGSPA